MSFSGLAAGSIILLAAAVFCLSKENGPGKTNTGQSAARLDDFANSLIAFNSEQLDRQISEQQQIIEMNRVLLDELRIPEPIYATERSALPVNKQAMADRNADFYAYSAALATAEVRLRTLLDAKKRLNDE